MFRSFFKSKRWSLWAYGGGLTLLAALFIQVELTVKMNQWYGSFYNILQKATEHNVEEFWEQMLIFGKIAFPYVLIATVTAYFTRVYAFKWREAMTFSYVAKWQTVEAGSRGSQSAYSGGYLPICPNFREPWSAGDTGDNDPFCFSADSLGFK